MASMVNRLTIDYSLFFQQMNHKFVKNVQTLVTRRGAIVPYTSTNFAVNELPDPNIKVHEKNYHLNNNANHMQRQNAHYMQNSQRMPRQLFYTMGSEVFAITNSHTVSFMLMSLLQAGLFF